MHVNWHEILDEQAATPVAVTRDRVRWVLGLFVLAVGVIFGRAVQLEVSDGKNFRRLAARPVQREIRLPATRGRIVAHDGTVLAADRPATALAVQFRYLQNPPDAAWLRRRARAPLTAVERRDAEHVRAMELRIRAELTVMHRRLARLCDISEAQWTARLDRIDRRVSALSDRVNARRIERYREHAPTEAPGDKSTLGSALSGLFAPPDPLPPTPIVVVEETAHHRIVDDVPAHVVDEINQHPQRYPGVKIVEHTRRDYPLRATAANVLGHVGRNSGIDSQVGTERPGQHAEETIGLMGIERRYHTQLAGQAGQAIQSVNRRGRVLATRAGRAPIAGRDVVLTIDLPLQRFAETWLDHHTRRPQPSRTRCAAHGGAVVVMDIHSGEVLVAASAPRFDPNLFVAGDPRVERVLTDPARPMFDRVAKMALPPGSVFKSLTALALVSQRAIDPDAVFHCQGFHRDPRHLRCQIFRQHGTGHGDVVLADALARSCNVYFFEHVNRLGGPRVVEWAARLGFGRPTGIELPDEAGGQLPSHEQLRGPSHTQLLAVGQGALTATPLQIARLYATIANGGYSVRPRITRDRPVRSLDAPPRRPIRPSESTRVPGLSDEAVAAVHQGLLRVVDDPNGTGFATVRLAGLSIAGKTGTAQTGGGREDHAWFAGYVPADAPRYAFVVVLQHGGNGGEAAGPIARALVKRMRERNYFSPSETADKRFPPGKG